MSSGSSSDYSILIQDSYCNSHYTAAKFGWNDFPIVGRSCCYPQLPYEHTYRSIDDDIDDHVYKEKRLTNLTSNTLSAAMITSTSPTVVVVSNAKNQEEMDYHKEMQHDGTKKGIPKQQQQQQHQLTIHPTKVQSFVTFGWNDFPILATPTCTNDFELGVKKDRSHCKNKDFFNLETMEAHSETIVTTTTIDESWTKSHINQPSCSNKLKKNVRFSPHNDILEQVRYYNIILGDHPLCESYPITFGWKYHDESTTLLPDNIEPLMHDAVGMSDQYDQRDLGSAFNPLRNGISCSKSYCRRIPIQERRQRLSHSMGVTSAQLDDLESIRQLSMLFV